MKILNIDGAGPRLPGYEAGGQILRVALALSPILEKSFKITNIRAGRPKSGLRPQHLTSVRAMAKITSAEMKGDERGSMTLMFLPKTIKSGEYKFDIGTAGSTTLFTQPIIPTLLFSEGKSKITVIGGTHNPMAPTADYYKNIFFPVIRKMGVKVDISINRYGFYPRGGGEIVIDIEPSKLSPINLTERGELKKIKGICAGSGLKNIEDIFTREEEGVKEIFPEAEIIRSEKPSFSQGTGITLWAEYENTTIGASAIGERGKRAEIVGKEAAQNLKREIESGGVLDHYMTDQILIFMAFAKGKSTVKVPELTPHAKTCMWLIPQFTNKEFKVDGNLIEVEGIE